MNNLSLARGTKVMVAALALFITGIIVLQARTTESCNGEDACCSPTKNQKTVGDNTIKLVACKLTSKEMQQRKETVLASLRSDIMERKELPNGYSFKFGGDDATIDRLIEFVKTERACCGFFTFNLSITEDYAQLDLTGPEGAKEFVHTEMGL